MVSLCPSSQLLNSVSDQNSLLPSHNQAEKHTAKHQLMNVELKDEQKLCIHCQRRKCFTIEYRMGVDFPQGFIQLHCK